MKRLPAIPDYSGPLSSAAVAAVLACLAMLIGGCPGVSDLPPVEDEVDANTGAADGTAPNPWRKVFNRQNQNGWWTVVGRTAVDDGVLVFNPAHGEKAVSVATAVGLKDGAVRVEALHEIEGYDDPRPYTISLRVHVALDWSALYMVCRENRLDIHRGSSGNPYPPAEAKIPFEAPPGPRTWRFEMKGENIRIYLNGEHLHTYTDPRPRAGAIAITADHCRLFVSRVDVKQ
ncbi:MAG: hypothetical protein ACLFV7_01210 [Phycisphaerae bacterium]